MLKFTHKQEKLIDMYSRMVDEGYNLKTGGVKEDVYNDFELSRFRESVKRNIESLGIKSVLDYGCGGSDWYSMKIFDGMSASDFFKVDKVYRYEPARALDERQKVDACFCFDVLEHIFIADIFTVLTDIFSYAEKLVVINVACYEADALLPNGENAHVTVRPPIWWKGVLDMFCSQYPGTSVLLYCSKTYRDALEFPTCSANQWIESATFKVQ